MAPSRSAIRGHSGALRSTISVIAVLGRLFALLVLAALVAGGVYYWQKRGHVRPPRSLEDVGGEIKDTATTGAVKAAFGLNRRLREHDVSVSTENGVVTLRGELPSADLRSLAMKVAQAVPDVRVVVDQLRVADKPAAPKADGRTLGESLDDRSLEVQVRLAFSLHRDLKGADVTVRSFKRQLTLTGEVASEAQRSLAVEIAQETGGVEGVRSELRVKVGSDPGTGGRRRAAEAALAGNASLAGTQIEVAEADGGLVLKGRVRSAAERDLAALLARDAAGGPVRNVLEIRP
jgi:hyperosmotically inducible periplasmic protein